MTRITVIGEARVGVPEGAVLVGEVIADRRVATGQRRRRGLGGGAHFRRMGSGAAFFGRRSGDADAHRERRNQRAVNGRPSRGNPLGQYFLRRKGDERRESGFDYSYASSRDPRVRALDRREHPQAAAAAGSVRFRRYEPVSLGAAEKELRAYAAGKADDANAKAGFSGRSA